MIIKYYKGNAEKCLWLEDRKNVGFFRDFRFAVLTEDPLNRLMCEL